LKRKQVIRLHLVQHSAQVNITIHRAERPAALYLVSADAQRIRSVSVLYVVYIGGYHAVSAVFMFLHKDRRIQKQDSADKGGVSISDVNVQINEQIRDKEVRVISEDGEQLGIMSSEAALKLADEAGLDLVKIAPNAAPPVVKIIDFSKYRYEQRRKEKEQKKKQNVIEVKEVRLTPNIDTNDLNTKVSAARKFLEKGNKVKVTLRFRGRELSRMNQSKYILDDFAATLSEIAQIDKPSKTEGRSLVMILSPKKAK